jgi:hypothetical protein
VELFGRAGEIDGGGVLNRFDSKLTNGRVESINSLRQEPEDIALSENFGQRCIGYKRYVL